ncbi:MAG: hypothetical protein FJ288_15430 [Planctomycetes bacterium]|nr:hypothetical protein [Planctomycetota bacterium]
MNTVFIGGSKSVVLLDGAVRRRLDRIMAQRFPVVIGDAGGADKAVQHYLHHCGYRNVEVFCMDGCCRHNVGRWPLRTVASGRRRKDFAYYAMKDRLMAETATTGFMIWDGRSAGTLANVARLVRRAKPVLVHLAGSRRAVRLTREATWEKFLSDCPPLVRDRLQDILRTEEREAATPSPVTLF